MVVKTIALTATTRDLKGKKVKKLRARRQLPAVVYGQGAEATPITIDLGEFGKIYDEAGTSSLVDLAIDDKKPIKVLIHEPQAHYLSGEPLHVDFYAVKMSEKIETEIPIEFVGVAPAVDELEGNFISNKDELTIRCFPGDLIPHVEVDISVLKTFDDQIRVGDIKLPGTIEVMDDSDEVVALVQEQRSEAELEEDLSDTGEAEEAAVAELGKVEESGEEATEGKDQDKDEPAQ